MRTLPLGLPSASKLVLDINDLPAGYNATGLPNYGCPYDRCVDSHIAQYAHGSQEPRYQITSGAFVMETPADAHALVVRLTDGPQRNVTRPAWGDEATFDTQDHTHFLVLRNASLVWTVSQSFPDAPDVDMETIVQHLLAKLPDRSRG